ncbi:MAG: cell division protein ZapB [Candidatus Azotimanducaceae bacterium]|jgi:cell division protein ZapB|tara:strand:- start:64 stop:285 length:222 start_codon:yes stop_codon:yes gene_type:complete
MTDPLYPNEELNRLERQVDNLIALVHLFANENKALKTQQSNWTIERAKLIEKNELAKNRVESMIGRLKTLEKD